MAQSQTMSGYRSDAAAWGRTVREIVKQARPTIWRHLGSDEGAYVKWAATWAFHWARLAAVSQMNRPVIWYSPEARHWWMEPDDAWAAMQIIRQHPDAIHVTNAYDVLPPEFVAHLKRFQGHISVVIPPSVGAVDPSVTDPGKPSTRA